MTPALPPEQLISALVPAAVPRPVPVPPPIPVLPVRRLPADAGELPLLDMARLDRSGRVSACTLIHAIGWRSGTAIDIDVVDSALLVSAAPSGAHRLGSRGEVPLPAPVRTLCGIRPADRVVLAAYPALNLIAIHPVEVVARLVYQLHNRSAADDGP